MFLNLEAGQDKIIFIALKVPESLRADWFEELRAYMRHHVPKTFGAVESDLHTILDLIDQTQEALR